MIARNDRIALAEDPRRTGTVVEVRDGQHVFVELDRPIVLSNGFEMDTVWRHPEQLLPLTKVRAQMAVIMDVLDDKEWTARVVAGALIAQDQLDRNHPAWDTLSDAFTQEVSA